MANLAGKTIVVLGGSSGMGLATATAAVANGASVVIAGRDKTRLCEVAAQLGNNVRIVVADGSEADQVAHLFEVAGPIDHVFTTVGGLVPEGDQASIDQIQYAVSARIMAAFSTARYGASRMRDGGSFVFMSGAA